MTTSAFKEVRGYRNQEGKQKEHIVKVQIKRKRKKRGCIKETKMRMGINLQSNRRRGEEEGRDRKK